MLKELKKSFYYYYECSNLPNEYASYPDSCFKVMYGVGDIINDSLIAIEDTEGEAKFRIAMEERLE